MRWCPLISQVCLSGLGSVVDKMHISMISSTSKYVNNIYRVK